MSDRLDDENSIFTDPDADKENKDPFTDGAEDTYDPFTAKSSESGRGDVISGDNKTGEDASPEDGKEEEENGSPEDEKKEESSVSGNGDSPSPEQSSAEQEIIGETESEESKTPSEKEDKTAKSKEKEHDFDDEPRFDTQTGEPLDKPKSKVPGILLTIVVTAAVAGAIGAAVVNKDSWNKTSISDEAETEGTDLVIAGQTEEAQTEKTTEKAEEIQSEKTSETESEKQTDTEAAETSGLVPGPDAESETESETETEKESEAGSLADSIQEELGKNTVSLNTSLDVSDMVEKVLPSVVSVTSQSVRTVESFFYGEQQIRESNVGSGIIIDEDDDHYYIVTDANLAARADDLTVGFAAPSGREQASDDGPVQSSGEGMTQPDETEGLVTLQQADEDDGYLTNGSDDQKDDTLASAELVGADAGSELAVLSVKKADIDETVRSGLKKAVLGDSDKLRIGQRAVAIGDALGYGQSVTQGIISALGRSMQSEYGVHEYIQTDASINYGNYGGALLNLDGQVIGINAGKVSRDSTEGMGYALPVNDAITGIRNILNGRGEGLVEAGSSEKETEAAEDAQAEEAGSGQTEAILTVPHEDEKPVSGSETENKPEKQSETENKTEDQSEAGQTQSSRAGLMGVHVGEISEENQIIYRIPEGVYVAAVDEGSGAQAAGLKEGDVITEVDGKAVPSVAELKKIMKDTKAGDQVKVTYVRPDKDGNYGGTEVTTVTLQ